jgi:hypothetical protein
MASQCNVGGRVSHSSCQSASKQHAQPRSLNLNLKAEETWTPMSIDSLISKQAEVLRYKTGDKN